MSSYSNKIIELELTKDQRFQTDGTANELQYSNPGDVRGARTFSVTSCR